MADEGKLQKMEVDYSSTVDEKIPQCEQYAKVGSLNELHIPWKAWKTI